MIKNIKRYIEKEIKYNLLKAKLAKKVKVEVELDKGFNLISLNMYGTEFVWKEKIIKAVINIWSKRYWGYKEGSISIDGKEYLDLTKELIKEINSINVLGDKLNSDGVYECEVCKKVYVKGIHRFYCEQGHKLL